MQSMLHGDQVGKENQKFEPRPLGAFAFGFHTHGATIKQP